MKVYILFSNSMYVDEPPIIIDVYFNEGTAKSDGEKLKETFIKQKKEVPEIYVEEFTAKGKPVTRKKVKAKPAAKNSCYQEFIKIYYEWFLDREKIPPVIDIVTGAGANKIIGYLKRIVIDRFKASNTADIELNILDEKVLESWKAILSNWDKLEKFLQDQTKLNQIYANIQNIIIQVKKAAKDDYKKKTSATASGTMQAVSKKFNNSRAN